MGEKATERLMILWSMRAQQLAGITFTTIRSIMACQGWTTLSTVHYQMISNMGKPQCNPQICARNWSGDWTRESKTLPCDTLSLNRSHGIWIQMFRSFMHNIGQNESVVCLTLSGETCISLVAVNKCLKKGEKKRSASKTVYYIAMNLRTPQDAYTTTAQSKAFFPFSN